VIDAPYANFWISYLMRPTSFGRGRWIDNERLAGVVERFERCVATRRRRMQRKLGGKGLRKNL
jgi:hypothetical protein